MPPFKTSLRLFFGLFLFVFGLNRFLQFMPLPPLSEAATNLMQAFIDSGYIMTVVAIFQIVCGLLLLFNRFTALALVLIFPILVNAFLFHLFLDISGIAGEAVAIAMNSSLFYLHKENYQCILTN